jgi:hypothetical protein
MTPRRSTWLDGRVDVLHSALADLGMSVSRSAAAELIQERVQWVASQMRVSPSSARTYLTDEALASLARTMVVAFADETLSAKIM